MSRKRLGIVTFPEIKNDRPEDKLESLIPLFAENKELADKYKKIADEANSQIKELMKESGLDEYQVGDVIVSYSISKRQSFDEDKLIQKLKPLKIRGMIKKKEYVDMDILETAIYTEKLDAAELTDCQITKEIESLRMKKAKK